MVTHGGTGVTMVTVTRAKKCFQVSVTIVITKCVSYSDTERGRGGAVGSRIISTAPLNIDSGAFPAFTLASSLILREGWRKRNI